MRYERPCLTDRHVEGGFEGELVRLIGEEGMVVVGVEIGRTSRETTRLDDRAARYSTIASTSLSDTSEAVLARMLLDLVDDGDLSGGR